MADKSISKKITSIVGIIAAIVVLLFQARYVFQNLYIPNITQSSRDVKYLKVGLEYGFMLLFGVVSLVLTVLTNVLSTEKKKVRVRNLAIAATVFTIINLVLSIIFITLESTYHANFTYEGKRSFRYFSYDYRKYILIFVLSIIEVCSYFMNFAKQTRERINQAWIYILCITLITINSMFLMVTTLDAFKSGLNDYKTQSFIIPAVVISIVLYLLSIAHYGIGITQRRVVSNDKLDINKVKKCSLSFIILEAIFSLTSIALLLAIIIKVVDQKSLFADIYLSFFSGELLINIILFVMPMFAQARFSSDERLVFERNERLAQQIEIEKQEAFSVK